MSLPLIPEKLVDWNIEILNELTRYVGIESEAFDFKKEPRELEEHVCAMANTKGGFLVLGIEQINSNDKTRIIKFEKIGFRDGKQDVINNQITEALLLIEPKPPIEIKQIEENDKFYVVIKVQNKISNKPYFVKSTDQCFVRINTAKTRANRSIILQLFGSTVEQITNIEKLRSATFLVKEELSQTISRFNAIGAHPDSITPPVDLTFIRSAILSNYLFLAENDLLNVERYENFFFVLHVLEILNSQIQAFNSSTSSVNKQNIVTHTIGHSSNTRSNLESVKKIFDKVILICDDFLAKYR